jgi:hypothetical protein
MFVGNSFFNDKQEKEGKVGKRTSSNLLGLGMLRQKMDLALE